MTSNRDLAPTLLLDTPTAGLVAGRSLLPARSRRSAGVPRARTFGRDGRCRYAPVANAVTIGHLVVTPVKDWDDAKPAAINSITVHSASPAGPGSTVLLYRRGVHALGRERGYYALPAEAVLTRPELSSADRGLSRAAR